MVVGIVADMVAGVVSDMEVDTVVDMEVDMVADIVADMVANMVANIVVDMVADMAVDKIADISSDKSCCQRPNYISPCLVLKSGFQGYLMQHFHKSLISVNHVCHSRILFQTDRIRENAFCFI